MKISTKRYSKLVTVLEFIFSDIAKNVGGEFFSSSMTGNVNLRDDINTHLHYYKDNKMDNEGIVIYVTRMLIEQQNIIIWGASIHSIIRELSTNPIYKKYKV